jgi:hypothetical protein
MKYSRWRRAWTCTAGDVVDAFQQQPHARSAGRMARLHRARRLRCAGTPGASAGTSFTIFSQEDPVRPLQAYIEQRPAIADYLENCPGVARCITCCPGTPA